MKSTLYRDELAVQAARIETSAKTDFITGGIAGRSSYYAERSGAFTALAELYAERADEERQQRLAEQAEGQSIRRMLDILEVADGNLMTDAQFAAAIECLLGKFLDRETPVAFAGKGFLSIHRYVSQLSQLMACALDNDGIVLPDGPAAGPYDDERRVFDRTEARAINAAAAA